MLYLLLLMFGADTPTSSGVPPVPVTYTDPLARPDTRPLVSWVSPHPSTLELYDRLPEYVRTLDKSGYVLKFLALIGDEIGAGDDLLDRLIPGEWPSDLTNPWTADAGWLLWLAQLAGVDLSGTSDVNSQRYLLANAANGHLSGGLRSVQAAVIPFLTGDRRLTVTRNVGGDSWKVDISVYGPEVSNQSALESALESVRPAGVQFTLTVQSGISIDQLTGTIDALPATYAVGSINALVGIPPP